MFPPGGAVGAGESYDVAFEADNPGLWMFHCHIANHAARGMTTMVDYPDVATPFRAGRASGTRPNRRARRCGASQCPTGR